MQNNTQESWEEELSEYGILHSEDCRFYFEDSRVCDFDVGEVDCCENMIIIKQFIRSLLAKQAEEISEAVEGLKKYHKEFECNGAYNGKGCYETFCEDQNCRNAPLQYNQALSDTLLAIKQITIK